MFGASTPLAKILIGDVNPWLLAGLLYLGSAIGLGSIILFRYFSKRKQTFIPKSDYPWLGLATLFGGLLGPVLLMQGLVLTPASSAALFLNLEGVLTSILAWLAFKEHSDRRIIIGMVFIVIGGMVLALPSGEIKFENFIGPLFIIGACFCWGLDNNFTRKISTSDAVTLTFIKGLIAGITNCALALSIGSAIPAFSITLYSFVLGFFGYGLSIVLFVLALRHLGASRTGAYFSTAPFLGSLISIAIFPESVSLNLIAAGILMVVGVFLHLTENHSHEHIHERLEHSHPHTHDEHHQHDRYENLVAVEGHSHVHEPLNHTHGHFPDIHHQHTHKTQSQG